MTLGPPINTVALWNEFNFPSSSVLPLANAPPIFHHSHNMTSSMAEWTAVKAAAGALRSVKRQRISANHYIIPAATTSALSSQRHFSIKLNNNAPNQPSILGLGFNPGSSPPAPTSYFQRPSLPANTVIRFVPQQTAWIVERMGKFNRIL